MTEEEAKKCWCPAATRPRPDVGSACIGSQCMAWRWLLEAHIPTDAENVHEITPVDCIKPIRVTRGYCGLAGKPC